MNAEELKRRLEEAGIPVGSWGESTPGEKPVPPTVQRQVESLVKLKGILEAQLREDVAKRAALYETVSRLKHGGGQ